MTRVIVSSSHTAGKWQVVIQDNGPGFGEVDPFAQDQPSRAGRWIGAGMGLRVSQTIMRGTEGISISNNHGAKVTLTFQSLMTSPEQPKYWLFWKPIFRMRPCLHSVGALRRNSKLHLPIDFVMKVTVCQWNPHPDELEKNLSELAKHIQSMGPTSFYPEMSFSPGSQPVPTPIMAWGRAVFDQKPRSLSLIS